MPFDGSYSLLNSVILPAAKPGDRELKKQLAASVAELARLQPMLFAQGRYAVLLVFQAMDAGGKDGTIREVTRGVNPA